MTRSHAEPAGAQPAIYREFERERREQQALLFSIFATCALLCANGVALSAWFFGIPFHDFALVLGGLASAAVVAALAWWFAWRRFVLPAVLGVVIACLIATVAGQVQQLNSGDLNGFFYCTFVVYMLLVVLSGIVNNRFLVIVVALLVVTVTFALLFLPAVVAPRTFYVLDLQRFRLPLFLQLAILELATGALTILTLTGYQRALQQLSAARIAYRHALQVDELKDQFISSVNHELRNPLMALQGFLDLFMLGEALPAPERQGLVRRASEIGVQLLSLVEHILDVRRIDQTSRVFPHQRVNLLEALSAAVTLAGLQESQEHPLTIAVPGQLEIWGDPLRLQEILLNLLTNASKYAEPGTPIEVRARAVFERRAKVPSGSGLPTPQVMMTVRDYGLGIPPDQIGVVFERFVRLPRDLHSKTKGNGLGLYLCRVYAESMDGHIWAESAGLAGQGSAFHLVLPMPALVPA